MGRVATVGHTFSLTVTLSFSPNASVSYFISISEGRVAWNLYFKCNLTEREGSEMQILSTLLEPIQIANQPDTKVWTLEPSGLYSCKSFDHLKKYNI